MTANRLITTIEHRAQEAPDYEAYRFCWRKEGEWLSTSRGEFVTQTHTAARALLRLGLLEKDTIAICSPNTPQILITEIGAFRNRISVIPLYSSSSQQQFDFIVADGGAKVIFIGDKHQYPLAYNYWKRHPELKQIVILKNDGIRLEADDTVSICWDDFVCLGMEASEADRLEVEARTARALPEDMATLIYTSGTTGEPKGVCITHSNYDAAMRMHEEMLTAIRPHDISMAFLPMSHILEKAWCFFCLYRGIPIAVNYDPRVIQDTIKEVQPNLMCCVPRFWEKVYAGVRDKIAGMSALQRMMVNRAIKVGARRNIGYMRTGMKVPRLLEAEYKFWDRRIFSRLKAAIGIPDPNFFPTAGAPLSDRICEFMRSVGIEIIIGYGLSETTATVSCFRPTGYEIGTVGLPLPEVQVRISDEGEILVKGPTVTPGYYNNPEANAAAFTEDGFFRTGDAGYITDGDAIVLTERVKDLFKTSNGKYIAPQMLESRLAENKYIDEVAVIGDRRKYVTALVVPNISQLRAWCGTNKIDTSDTETMLRDPRVYAHMMGQINQLQADVAEYEKIKKIYLLPHHFSIMHGEVTNTMKVRRPVVAKRYEKEIESMYSE
ncbi:MAG: long-chain fatty acid--CoA ligase [Muribaculaceae bacterium]|nr:long-chain fatty acid--CoA ligase [Muribaculaceae bacterium]